MTTDKEWLDYMAKREIPSNNGVDHIFLPVLAREILKLRERVSSEKQCPDLYSYDYDTNTCVPNSDYKIDNSNIKNKTNNE